MKNTFSMKARGDREIVIIRAFDAPRQLVFDAFTTTDLVRRWLLGPPGWSMPVCEIDLRVGGAYRYEWRKESGAVMAMGGVFRELEPPQRIVHTELFDEDWTGGETVVTTTFEEQDGGTTVTMVIQFTSADARDGALGSGMEGGMADNYDRLEGLLQE